VLLLLALTAGALASCPNSCSGHGRCGEWDMCTCFYRWTGPDCSQRLCKEGIAWAQGGQTSPHAFQECSNKGVCNRDTGECECYPEYEGAACERSVCPNGCSGHGTCQYIQEFSTMRGSEWEYNKIQACRCDGGFYGTDCSKRLCPRGDDPITIRAHSGSNTASSTVLAPIGETYTVRFEFINAATIHTSDFYFHFEIDDMWNTTHRSRPIKIPSAQITAGTGDLLDPTVDPLQTFVRVLLDMDPISALDMTAGGTYAAQPVAWTMSTATNLKVVTLKFKLADPLRVHAVRVRYNNECTVPGCYPLMPTNTYAAEDPALVGFPGGTYIDADLVRYSVPKATVTLTDADPLNESEECSDRGLCDYTTGTCKCFAGFFGNSCEKQTILV